MPRRAVRPAPSLRLRCARARRFGFSCRYGGLRVEREARALARQDLAVQLVLVAIAARRDHVTLVHVGLARADQHGREHPDLVLEEAIEVADHRLLQLAIRALDQRDRGVAAAMAAQDRLRLDDLTRAPAARG